MSEPNDEIDRVAAFRVILQQVGEIPDHVTSDIATIVDTAAVGTIPEPIFWAWCHFAKHLADCLTAAKTHSDEIWNEACRVEKDLERQVDICSTMTEQNENSQREKADLNAKLVELSKGFEEKRGEISNFERLLEEKNVENSALKQQIETCSTVIESFNANQTELEQEISCKKAEIENWERQVEACSTVLESLNATNKQLDVKLDLLERAVEEKGVELSEAKAKVGLLEKASMLSKRRLKLRSLQGKRLKASIKAAVRHFGDLNRQLATNSNEVERWKTALDNQVEEGLQLAEQLARSGEELIEAKAKIVQLEMQSSELADLKVEFNQIAKVNKEKLPKYERLKEEFYQLRKSYSKVANDVQRLEKALKLKSDEAADVDKAADTIEQLLGALKHQEGEMGRLAGEHETAKQAWFQEKTALIEALCRMKN